LSAKSRWYWYKYSRMRSIILANPASQIVAVNLQIYRIKVTRNKSTLTVTLVPGTNGEFLTFRRCHLG
jgi:hypothetical protein